MESEISNEEKNEEKNEKRKRKKTKFFDIYIQKALKQVSNNEITNNAKQQLNNLLIIVAKLITEKTLYLVEISKKKTISIKELENSIGILFSGELKNVIIEEGKKSVIKFRENIDEEEKKGFSVQNKIGIIFPPSMCEKFLRKFGNSNVMITIESPVYLASVLEYISAEILDLSSSIASAHNRIRITVRDLEIAIRTDYEFNSFFNKNNIYFIGGGIIPFINPIIKNKNKKKSEKTIIKEINKLQKEGDCLIFAKHPFEQVIRYIVNQYKKDVKISKNVFLILQYYIENEMLNLIQKAYNLSIYAGRIKLISSDLEMILSIQENRLPNFLQSESQIQNNDDDNIIFEQDNEDL